MRCSTCGVTIMACAFPSSLRLPYYFGLVLVLDVFAGPWSRPGCGGGNGLRKAPPDDGIRKRGSIILYYWPEPAESQVLASAYDLSDPEKSEVLRCHVNLGHPNKREFARVLKAAGSRHDVVQYVLRECDALDV